MATMFAVVSLIALRKLSLYPWGMSLLSSSDFDDHRTGFPKPAREMTASVKALTSNCSSRDKDCAHDASSRRVCLMVSLQTRSLAPEASLKGDAVMRTWN